MEIVDYLDKHSILVYKKQNVILEWVEENMGVKEWIQKEWKLFLSGLALKGIGKMES